MEKETKKGGAPESREMNLSDFALFLSVMRQKRAYECVLSVILEEEELELAEVQVEQVVLNRSGKRAIRLDAWARDQKRRLFNTEMQNDTGGDDVKKRSRFYQGLLDSPVLKAGKETRYRELPETVIIFITQEDLFGKDLARYTFTEQCEEVEGLHLEDGTKKIFLNMSSRNGRPELVGLLQYMKETRLDNPRIPVRDRRIEELDEIVQEVKQSEEWEAVRMNILEIGIAKGKEEGIAEGGDKKVIELICKKLSRGKSVESIAQEVEEPAEKVAAIVSLAQKHAPGYDYCKVYEDYAEKSGGADKKEP